MQWAVAAIVPGLVCLLLVPLVLLRIAPPEIRQIPNARQIARDELEKMGPMSRDELVLSFVFRMPKKAHSVSDRKAAALEARSGVRARGPRHSIMCLLEDGFGRQNAVLWPASSRQRGFAIQLKFHVSYK